MDFIPPQPPSLLLQQCASPLQLSVINAPPPQLAVLLQGWRGNLPPTSAMRAYDPLLSALLLQLFDPPLQPSNMPAPLPQISALLLQPLAQNHHPLPSVLLQGEGGTLLLPSVAHAHPRLIPRLRLWQGVPPLLSSNVIAPLAHISALPLQQGGPRLQTSALNYPPLISAFLVQQYVLSSSAFRFAWWSYSSYALCLNSRVRRTTSSNFSRALSCSSTFSLVPSLNQASYSSFSRKSSFYSSYFSLSSSTVSDYSSASIHVCYSSSSIRLNSRAIQTTSSTFNPARLWFLNFFFEKVCLFVIHQQACSSSSDFILASSTRHAYSSASSYACSSSSFSALWLASRARRTPTSTFSRARLCSSALVMGSDVCISWKCIVLCHSANWHDHSSNST